MGEIVGMKMALGLLFLGVVCDYSGEVRKLLICWQMGRL
jgi:hypothetical protein